MPQYGLPSWEEGGNRAGKGKNQELAGLCLHAVAGPAPVIVGLCKAVVAMARQLWESQVEELCFGVVGGDSEPP